MTRRARELPVVPDTQHIRVDTGAVELEVDGHPLVGRRELRRRERTDPVEYDLILGVLSRIPVVAARVSQPPPPAPTASVETCWTLGRRH